MSKSFKIITIDGPAGAGKSTVARLLAARLQFSYLDTGAMYRSLTLKALNNKINLQDQAALIRLAEDTKLVLEDDGGESKVYLDGKDVSSDIRSAEVTNNAFYIAGAPGIRKILVEWQRQMGQVKNVVVEGRDVGTVVFPDADTKFYLDADQKLRAKRRVKEMEEKGQKVEEEDIAKKILERDKSDMNRNVGPLKKASDAIIIDSTSMSVDEVVDKMLGFIKDNE